MNRAGNLEKFVARKAIASEMVCDILSFHNDRVNEGSEAKMLFAQIDGIELKGDDMKSGMERAQTWKSRVGR